MQKLLAYVESGEPSYDDIFTEFGNGFHDGDRNRWTIIEILFIYTALYRNDD